MSPWSVLQRVEAAPKAVNQKKRPLPAPGSAPSGEVVDGSIQQSLQGLQSYLGRSVSRIELVGLKRIEKDAVLGKIAARTGGALKAADVRDDIRTLYEMGYFDEIAVRGSLEEGGKIALKYAFKERPVISKVEFEGNERVGTKDLEDVAKVKAWSILDVSKVREDVSLLQKYYESKGFYLAKIRYEVKAGKADDVTVTYRIDDYDKVQIKKITFLNNKRFSDEQLKNVLMETREGGLFSFMSGSGSFKETAFKTDLQRLTYHYLDHGYLKFKYENPIVTVSDDKRFLFITIYVDEGEQYAVRGIDYSGDLLFKKEELRENTTLVEPELFSITKRNADIQKLSEMYQDLGYAFVNVIPKMDIRDEDRTVAIDYSFEKGNLVYFGEITMLGNTKTHDKVIRRELRFKEGELYSGTKFRESREAVERLGFFAPGEVVFNPITPKGKDDRLNVEITVKERSTGTITVGAGFGSVQGFFLQTQISEINLFGRGQNLTLTGQFAGDKASRSFNLGFTDPYSFDSKWTLGFDLYYVNFPIPNKYTTRKLGFDVRAGYPLFDFTTFFLTYKNEGMQIEAEPNSGLDPDEIAADQGVLSSVIWSVVRDRRNNRFETTDGNYQSVSIETAGIGGDKKFLKLQLNNRYYKRLFGDLVFRNSVEYGQIQGQGGKRTPPSERFYLGGPNNLKGYEIYSVGPSRQRTYTTSSGLVISEREPLGGVVQMFSIFELEHPLIREAGLKFVLFYDVGNAFGRFPTGSDFELRQDYGFGFRWFSPIGPLRFEFGYPIGRKAGESGSVFSFFIGPPF